MRRLTGKALTFLAISMICLQVTVAQNSECDKPVEAGLFDMGKMWTFDYAPADYFAKTYNFTPDEKWFENARLAALRFGNGCSASFVSSEGLVMTNHHCARGSGFKVQRPGENFNENGFYALKLSDERRVEDLFVDQLVKIEDITSKVLTAMAKENSDAAQVAIRDKELAAIKKEYSEKPEWKGLEIQPIQFYNGGKFSLYGFKRYKDVRLVFMPELHLGFFGGDYDNFTYPRYNLDCSFFRVYDDTGKPVKTEHYFKFNSSGPNEGEPVFVIGNPGTTLRLSTISDLEFRRDKQLPLNLELYKKVSLMYQAYNEKAKSDSIINIIFGLENSWKATNGEYEGLKDPCILARKASFETQFKKAVQNNTSISSNLWYWNEIEKTNKELSKIYDEYSITGATTRFSGQFMQFAHGTVNLVVTGTEASRKEALKKRLASFSLPKEMELEEQGLAIHLQMALNRLGSSHPYVQAALNGKTPAEAAKEIIKNTRLKDAQFRNELLTKDSAALWNTNDPLLNLAKIAVPSFNTLSATYRDLQSKLFAYRSKIGRMLFDIYGTQIPPDATFSLRINDGVVKGYEYNGTIAPPFTTYFGLYDRFYSFSKKYPFTLPKRWENPPAELLRTRLNFVSTNDIIGGNSGSAMVNKNLEVIGLVFDGNMESLPGRFIFIPDENRAVGVHSGGMLAAIKYIYKANRLLNELTGKK
jgi:hypothetical protein